MASPWPRSSAPTPQNAPPVSTKLMTGRWNFSASMRETQGLSVALRVRHAEVGVHVLLDGAALAVADHGHRGAAEIADAAEDGVVVTEK